MKDLILKQRQLATKHRELKEELRKSLLMGQLSFLNAGKLLAEIKTNKTYLTEREDLGGSWTDFIKDTDLAIPGDTLSSRIRIAQILMNVYNFFVKSQDLNYSNETYAQIGYSKLNLIMSPIRTDKKNADEWIEKAKNLSFKDLQIEIKNIGGTMEDDFNCEHKDLKRVVFWKCEDCGQVFHDDPNSSATKD